MLPMIPAMIAITMVLGYVISMYTLEEYNEVPTSISQNMLLQHRQAVMRATDDGLPDGAVGSALGTVFRDIGDWNSQVISSDDRRAVVTWAGPDAIFSEADQIRAMAMIGYRQFEGLPETSAGPYTYTDTGGQVGTVVVDDFVMLIAADVPAIISIIVDESGSDDEDPGTGEET